MNETTIYLLDGKRIHITGRGKTAALSSNLLEENEKDVEVIAAINTLESFVLALHCAGFEVNSEEFTAAVQTTWDAIYNNIID